MPNVPSSPDVIGRSWPITFVVCFGTPHTLEKQEKPRVFVLNSVSSSAREREGEVQRITF